MDLPSIHHKYSSRSNRPTIQKPSDSKTALPRGKRPRMRHKNQTLHPRDLTSAKTFEPQTSGKRACSPKKDSDQDDLMHASRGGLTFRPCPTPTSVFAPHPGPASVQSKRGTQKAKVRGLAFLPNVDGAGLILRLE